MSDEDDVYDGSDDDFELDDELVLEMDDAADNPQDRLDPKQIDSRRKLNDLLEQRRLEKEINDLW